MASAALRRRRQKRRGLPQGVWGVPSCSGRRHKHHTKLYLCRFVEMRLGIQTKLAHSHKIYPCSYPVSIYYMRKYIIPVPTGRRDISES